MDSKCYPWLYKVRSDTKTLMWRICIKVKGDSVVSYTEYGTEGGTVIVSESTVVEPKNVGRKNETSGWEQAEREAEATIEKKRKSGYSEEKQVGLLKVKAQKYMVYADKSQNIVYPAHYQRKLDGHNATACYINGNVVLYSREGETVLASLPNVRNELKTLFEANEESKQWCLNGEMYIHGVSIADIASVVRKDGTRKDAQKKKQIINPLDAQMQFWVYDAYSNSEPGMPYNKRYITLERIFETVGKSSEVPTEVTNSSVLLLHSDIVNSRAESVTLNEQFLKENFEGGMIKNFSSVYRSGERVKDMLKDKPYSDDDFKIVGYKSGSGKFEDSIIFICETDKGMRFSVVLKGTIESRKKMYTEADTYIGKYLNVKYIRLSADGIPNEPVGLQIR